MFLTEVKDSGADDVLKHNTLLSAAVFFQGDYRTLLVRFLATPLMRMQLHTGLCVNIMQAIMLIVTLKDMWCIATAGWVSPFSFFF